jgi:hypothetical protein
MRYHEKVMTYQDVSLQETGAPNFVSRIEECCILHVLIYFQKHAMG